MREVSDALLLNIAEVSAAMVGLFLVGMFFYVESGFRRLTDGRAVREYFRSSTRIVLVLYAFPIGLAIALVALDLSWSRVLFAVLSVVLIAANVDSARRSRGAVAHTRARVLALVEITGTIAVALLVVLPWALGGLHPSREDLTWAILLSFAAGFASICAAVLFAFDIAAAEDERASEADPDD